MINLLYIYIRRKINQNVPLATKNRNQATVDHVTTDFMLLIAEPSGFFF